MEFGLSEDDRRLQRRCLDLAADFATRAAEHDRAGSHPTENYKILCDEGFLELNIPEKWGGAGVGLLGHTIAFEALGQGCPSTALAFNMHASVVMPIMDTDEVDDATKHRLADLVVNQRKMIGGNFSEPNTTSLVGDRPLSARARRVEGGYAVSGRKMFASMIEAADYCAVMAYPDGATGTYAGMILLIPRDAAGRKVNPNWDTLGMRATRSDALVLDECRLPESAVMFLSDDIRRFRTTQTNWFWGSYTAVYLGVAVAAYDELRRVVKARQPDAYAQPLAYHPDVRRHVAELSADLEAARLITYRSAWLSDTQGPTPETMAALFRAKYVVGEAVARITRVALTLGGAHSIFKGSRLEQLFRDGAIGAIQPPPTDFCLWNMGIHELGLDPADIMPPMKPA
ncbi:MAG TPA: acyl-CoA dehydrogenase family protein [Stellaceae bacterium]|jgi:alkylation response protein AidB-like acyl-CoA dehydrogenase|nr:acyl-CoA dehydrogenase family protein [Stellaceae bacterium]